MPPAQLYVGKEIPSSVSSSKIYLHSNRQRLLAYYGRYPLEGRIVHGILAARLDAVPQAIECADSPPQLLVAFSGPPGPMNNGDTIGVLHNNRPERTRLNGIDCPEKRQAQGQRAKQATSELVFGKDVRLQTYGRDKSERTIADMIRPDGMSLNQELVKQG